MLIINVLNDSNITKQSVLDDINHEINRYIELNNISDAKDLLDKLNSIFKNNKLTDFNKQYQQIISKLKFICLPVLSEKEISNLLGESLLLGLNMNIDIYSKLDDLFKFFRDEWTGFESHKTLARSIGISKEIIGTNKILIKDENKTIQPSIENWIRDFSSTLSNNMPPSYLEEAEYLNRSSNVKSLTKNDFELLKKVLRIYNYLRFPVRSRDKVKDTGHIINREKDLNPMDGVGVVVTGTPMERLKQKYNTYRRARWNILKLEDEILVQTKGENESLKKELSTAARENNTERLIACIKILGRQNYLLESLRASPSWQLSLKEYIITKYAVLAEPDAIASVVERLDEDYVNPAIISEFLQYLFLDKLKMSQNEAALTAIEIGQLLGSAYELIAYGDQETGNFVFSKNKIDGNKLVMEK